MTDIIQVRFRPGFSAWKTEAKRLLAQEAAPERIWWHPDTGCPEPQPAPPAAAGSVMVPRSFVELARLVSCHADEKRWAFLYQALWRVSRGERHLLQLHGDPLVLQLNAWARSVRRDIHKMKAFVRFRTVQEPDAVAGSEPRYVAWYEPEHFIVELAAGFFRRRFANMRWSILTPYRCAHWDGSGEVWFTDGVGRETAPTHDDFEDAWRLYYRSIFNPARLKVSAMLSEMPQKYWKNLPEAQLIPGLVRDARQRSEQMQAQRKSVDEPRCGPLPETPSEIALQRLSTLEEGTLAHLQLQAAGCRRCPLWQPATQTVWGEGPPDARIMLIGEQPGDQEDLAGRPFVGPAGQLLDRALREAGLDRRSLYLTNTVKHFKFKNRGKRRLHEKPLDAEVLACIPWLQAEIARVKPRLLVCLGATAAGAQLQRRVRMNDERGKILETAPAKPARAGEAPGDSRPAILLTFHPSYLLRLPDPTAAEEAFAKLVADFKLARDWTDQQPLRQSGSGALQVADRPIHSQPVAAQTS